VLESNRELVLRRLLECLARDRTKHQVAEVTSLGLVQMTRKRVGAGLLEAFSVPCECCNGRGVIVTYDPEADAQAHHVHGRNGSGNGGSGNGGNGSRGAGGPASPATIAARIRTDGNGQDASPADERNPDGPGTNGQAETAAAEAPDSQPEPARSGNGRRRRRRPSGAAAQAAVVPDPVVADTAAPDTAAPDVPVPAAVSAVTEAPVPGASAAPAAVEVPTGQTAGLPVPPQAEDGAA